MRLPPGYFGLFLFALALGMGFGGAQVFGDPDTAWHLATGDLIRELGYVPMHDTWSYATDGEIWYNLSWLFDIGFSKLFAIGGFPLLYTVTVFAFAGAYAFMGHHCLKRGASISMVCVSLVLAMLVAWGSILARPNLSSILFTVAVYHLLSRYRDTSRGKYLVPLPFIMMAWANMHGGFLLAFPIIGLFGLEALLQRNWHAVRLLGVVVIFSIIGTLINPYGYGVYYGAYKTLSWGYDKLYVVEWQPVKVGHDLPLTLLLIAMLCAGDLRDKTIPFSDRMLALALTFMALSTMRHGPVAAALTMPYISLRLTALLKQSRFGKRFSANEAVVMQDMQKTDLRVMGLIMTVLAAGLLLSPFPRDALLKEPIGFPKKSFPAKEAEFIEKKYPHLRFMTDYNIGGWLDYIWRGRIKVFVDGRASSLFSKETLQDYADFAFESRGYGGRAKVIAKQYGFDGVIIPNDDPAAGDWHWNPDWRLVYQGDAAAIYLKKEVELKK